MHEPSGLIVRGGTVVTMDADRRVLAGGAVGVDAGRIVAVGSPDDVADRLPGAEVVDATGCIVTPGVVNAHQHVTADPLLPSTIPDDLTSDIAIFDWAVPLHGAVGPDDDELSATLAGAESLRLGVTTLIEAGTVAHPAEVTAGLHRSGIRARVGRWGWDVPDAGPLAAPADEVLAEAAALLDTDPGPDARVRPWVTLVGHDLMSEELLVGASTLARDRGVGLTFHISPHGGDPIAWLERSGSRPLVRFAELGVLGPHVLLAHAVHLDDAEVDAVVESRTAIAVCPWAYLRLGQGITRAGRHDEILARGGRIALGCDAQNAGDHLDVLASARLFAGLYKDVRIDPSGPGAHTALELATAAGAEAVGLGDEIGVLAEGYRADLVVHDTAGAGFAPLGDPVLQLVWVSDGRGVRDVVVDGEVVVRDRRVLTVDVDALRAEAAERRAALLTRAGIDVPTGWPGRRSPVV